MLETEKADVYRIQGELLTANLHLMERGMEEITVENFYDDMKKMTIALDTRKHHPPMRKATLAATKTT